MSCIKQAQRVVAETSPNSDLRNDAAAELHGKGNGRKRLYLVRVGFHRSVEVGDVLDITMVTLPLPPPPNHAYRNFTKGGRRMRVLTGEEERFKRDARWW